MKYLSEFRAKPFIDALLAEIAKEAAPGTRYTFMEVCGTHTVAIARYGLKRLLPGAIRLVSGPGCPVCVTSTAYIDAAIARAMRPEVTIASFGDMIRVPGSAATLEAAKARGADVRVVLSVLDALALARARPERTVVFLGIGFETTVPTTAAALARARADGVRNFLVASAHKTMPVPMRALASDPAAAVEGYICPGHVCTVAGLGPFAPLVEEFHVPAAIAGFEPTDVLAAVLALVRQRNRGEGRLENLYRRSVRDEGNPKAWHLVESVFEPADAWWRGLGVLPGSGLALRREYAAHDADAALPVEAGPPREPAGCRCGDVLKGIIEPEGCPLFGKACTPERPVGACMVSSEGACHAAHRWGRLSES
ncbi:MAG TPA: hydrogenase formation protein HypD [Planctomycetes bacterium]|nr:hydrogenase formation protein HypD [Planctomycetota bacterium]